MNQVEEVEKILDKRYSRYKELLAHQQGTAEEICHLFEPKPLTDEQKEIMAEGYREMAEENLEIAEQSIQGDESRLLTDEELVAKYIEQKLQHLKPENRQPVAKASVMVAEWVLDVARKVQDARTASIKDAEFREYENELRNYYTDKINLARRIVEERKDAECRERVERIFREIEEHSAIEQLPYRDGGGLIRIIPDDTWQALKNKEIGEEK